MSALRQSPGVKRSTGTYPSVRNLKPGADIPIKGGPVAAARFPCFGGTMAVKIQAIKNGPLKVDGDFSVHNSDGTLAPHQGTSAALCRCGHSTNKPYCDGAHKKAEFDAD